MEKEGDAWMGSPNEGEAKEAAQIRSARVSWILTDSASSRSCGGKGVMPGPETPKGWDFVVGHSSPQAATPTTPPRTLQTIYEGSSTKQGQALGGEWIQVKRMLHSWHGQENFPLHFPAALNLAD